MFIDTIRIGITYNFELYLYGKQLDQKYYYFISTNNSKYYDETFFNDLDDITIVTKSDFTKIDDDEAIDGMYQTSYLKKESSAETKEAEATTNHSHNIYQKHEQMKNTFWKKYPLLNREDIPCEYVSRKYGTIFRNGA